MALSAEWRARSQQCPRHVRLQTGRRRAHRAPTRLQASQSADQAATATPKPSGVEVPTRLNNTPQPRESRRWFYRDAAEGVCAALKTRAPRLKMRLIVPETNPEMDVFRVGTLLEMVREVATAAALDGRRVRVCVQGSMGQGVFQGLPLSLSGVAKIMKMMDWGDAEEFVSFGEVSAEDADCEADVFLLIAPQNVVGSTIMTNLLEMVEAAEQKGKQTVLINPILKDVQSAGGVMGVRGRQERIAFADSFATAYHFRLLYRAGTFYPIVGCIRHTQDGPWEVSKRVQVTRSQEEYQLWGSYESEPDGAAITACMKETVPLLLRGREGEVSPNKKKKDAGKWWL